MRPVSLLLVTVMLEFATTTPSIGSYTETKTILGANRNGAAITDFRFVQRPIDAFHSPTDAALRVDKLSCDGRCGGYTFADPYSLCSMEYYMCSPDAGQRRLTATKFSCDVDQYFDTILKRCDKLINVHPCTPDLVQARFVTTAKGLSTDECLSNCVGMLGAKDTPTCVRLCHAD